MNQADYQKTSFEGYLKSKALSHSGINSRMVVIGMFWKWLEKEHLETKEVSYNDLLLFMKYKSKKGASQRTIQHYMGVINHFYKHLLREEKVASNPVIDIEVKGVKRKMLYHILQTHELHQLYNKYTSKTIKAKREKVMLGLLINQGITTSEVRQLEIKDVNLTSGTIRIPGGIRSNSREMKLESHQVMDIYDYVHNVRKEILQMESKRKSQVQQESEKLFIAPGGNASHISNMMTLLMINVRKLNPSVLNAKQIRASVITKWLKIYNLREVQYLAGHRYISSTESFLENDMEGLQEEVQQYHPLG